MPLGHPIFWLGPKKGYTYELTQTGNGKIYVRYLPHGVDVGADKPYLTVATYPFPGAYAAIRKQATAKGAVTARLAGGGVAVLDDGYPESVHVAYPGVDYQVEVYDPTPARRCSSSRPAGSGTSAACWRPPRQRHRAAPLRPRPPSRSSSRSPASSAIRSTGRGRGRGTRTS